MDQKGNRERQHDQQLQPAQERGNAHRQPDSVARQRPDDGECQQRDDPPRNVHVELISQNVRYQITKETRGPRGAEKIVNQVAPGRHETRAAAEPTRRKGVIAAARWHVPGKLRHGIANEQADDGCQQERERHGRTGLEGDDRKCKQDVGGRRDVRDTLEHQFRKTERIASQLRFRGRVGCLSDHGRSLSEPPL
jgi:hypothetical protein